MINVLRGYIIIFFAGFKEWYNFNVDWANGTTVRLGDLIVAIIALLLIIKLILGSLGLEKE